MVDQSTEPTMPPEGGPISQAVEPPPSPAQGDPKPTDEPLGEGGKKALEAERQARKELEQRLKNLEPLQQLADAIRGGKHVPEDEKTEIERLSEQIRQLEANAESERLGRLRLEVATEKGLTPAQAARLQGSSREEFAADADALLALFPTEGPRRPAPDPTQGARGPVDLRAQIRDAEAKGDLSEAIRLKMQALATQ